MAGGPGPLKSDSPVIPKAATYAAAAPSGGVALGSVQHTSGTASSSPHQITLSGFSAGTLSSGLLVVGISSNNQPATSITFGGAQLTKVVSSFHNNDAEFWYLLTPTGTEDIVATMAGPTSAVVGAYVLYGVDLSNPIPTATRGFATASSSPAISTKV